MARVGDDGRLPSLAGAKRLIAPATRAVFAALLAEGADARAVGGSVRKLICKLTAGSSRGSVGWRI